MSCGVGLRCGSDPALLWPWCRLAAVAPIWPLAWECPYASGAALKSKKKKKNKVKAEIIRITLGFHLSHLGKGSRKDYPKWSHMQPSEYGQYLTQNNICQTWRPRPNGHVNSCVDNYQREGLRGENKWLSCFLACSSKLYARGNQFYPHNVFFTIGKCYAHHSRSASL